MRLLFGFIRTGSSTSNKTNLDKKSMAWKDYSYGVVAAVGTFIAFPVFARAGLSTLGFTSAGIAAGSIAAAIQASIGNVVAGSWFAIFTSWGMTATSTTASAIASAAAVGFVTFLKRFLYRP